MEWHTIFSGIVAIASIVAASGVVIGVQQLRHSKQQAQTNFEDDLSREYRSIAHDLPARVFYKQQPEALTDTDIGSFFRYFDLSNEQLWLAENDRIRLVTIEEWKDGMRSNLRLPAFARAWEAITENLDDDYWTRLRALHEEG